MSKVIFTRGLPGSGKSTWANEWVAEQSDTPRMQINRDNIRQSMGYYGVGNIEQESVVTSIHNSQFKAAVDNGFDIVISDTNLRARFVKEMVKSALVNNCEISFQDFPESLDVLIKRNKNRNVNEQVSEERLREMNMKFPHKKWSTMESIVKQVRDKMESDNESNYTKPFINDRSKKKAILVDVDGTIAHKSPDRDYHDYDESVKLDSPDMAIIDMVNTYYNKGYHIIIMSGRKNDCQEHTIEWMNENNVKFHDVHMRESNDSRPDWIVKDELVRAHIENKFYIEFCLDDRNQVVNHYRNNGFKVLQVAPGDF